MGSRKLLFLISVPILLALPHGLRAQTDGSLVRSDQYEAKLYAAVLRARDQLELLVEQDQTAHSAATVVKSKTAAVDVTLAVWNPDTDVIDYLPARKQGKSLKFATKVDYQIRVKTDNGVNTEFEVTNVPGAVVVGLIHPIFVNIGTSARPKYRLDDVTYVPYSQALNVPSIAKAGRDYFDLKVDQVYEELRVLNVPSRALPAKLLADVISPALIKSIIAIEHVSAATILKGKAEDYLKYFYVVLATNQHRSYAYAKSSASARGLVQFIPATYKRLVTRRPELVLHSDFEQGMVDPYNAIKAAIGYLDENLTQLPQSVRERYADDNESLGAYLAAMYNGGPSRVLSAIKKYGDKWDVYHGVSQSLKRETANYVAKYRIMYDYFLATPVHVAVQ